MAKFYVTKYALTDGIREAPAEAAINATNGTAYLSWRELHSYAFLAPLEYTDDAEAAVTRANDMRKKKIASLKAQIKKLEAMAFPIKPARKVEK